MLMQRPGDNTASQAPVKKADKKMHRQRDALLKVALEIIHGKKTGDKIHKMVVSKSNPIDGLSSATVAVLMNLERQVPNIPEPLRVELGRLILRELTKLSLTAGLVSKEQVNDKKFQQEVLGAVVNKFVSQSQTKEPSGKVMNNIVGAGKQYMAANPDKFQEYNSLFKGA